MENHATWSTTAITVSGRVCLRLSFCLAFVCVIKELVGRVLTVCTLPRAVDSKEYQRTQTGGIIAFIVMLVVVSGTVIARDILQIWTCFGLTEAGYTAPTRQLTTMSAAFAPVVSFFATVIFKLFPFVN